MKALFLRNQISTTALLSSTTYKTNTFDRCGYCHKEVESGYFSYNNEYYQPHRCDCKKAKEEIMLKENFLTKISELQGDMDITKINEVTKETMISEIKRAFEENCEEILCGIIEN